jgi:apolipoprotein N-acyltransferase
VDTLGSAKAFKKFIYLAGPIISGGLLVLAFPNYNQAWLGWIGVVPLLLAIRRLKPWQAFLMGWIGGIVYFVGIFPWINEVKSINKLAIGLGHLYLGLYLGLFCACMNLLHRKLSAPLLTAAPLWVTIEYLRAHFFFLAFPWALLGHTQYLNLPILQIASFAGSYGVTFFMILVNGVIADLIVSWIGKRNSMKGKFDGIKHHSAIAFFSTLVAIIAIWTYGWLLVSEKVTGTPFSVGVVQGNIPQNMKFDPIYRDSIFSTYENLSKEVAFTHPKLIVWPETSTPGFILKNMELYKRMVKLVRDLNIHFLIGSAEYPKFGKKPINQGKSGNTALYFSPQGKILGQYLKIRLLPLGEYIPYENIIPWPHFIIPPDKTNFLIPGKEATLFNLEEAKFGVLICWENLFPDLSQQLAIKGANFIVNISNEAWFGKTAAPYQILSMCVFRAVENRISMVRATNTGISCFIDPYGRITNRVRTGNEELFVEGVSSHKIQLSSTGTFYTHCGDILAYGCIGIAIGLILFSILSGTSLNYRLRSKGELP